MKLILFGGAEVDQGQFLPQLKLIEQVIKRIDPKQVLHIPFARSRVIEKEWDGDWFNENIHLDKTIYLNAKNEEDVDKANNPLIFMNGGGDNENLLNKIKENPKLLKLVENAEYVIGESAGAKVLGASVRKKGSDENSELMKGLNIIKNTIIEPHYTERNRHGILIKDMKESGLPYGIGIDCVTAIEFDLNEFPEKYNKIGDGLVEVKIDSIL